MADFPVSSLFSVGNFNREERKVLGCAKYSLWFIDTAILVHFVHAAGVFLDAKRIREQTSDHTIRFGVACALGTVYLATFLSFFITFCRPNDAVSLIRARLSCLLMTGFISFMILFGFIFSVVYFHGTDSRINEFAVNLNKKSDLPWISVMGPVGTSALISFLAGMLALCAFANIRKISSLFNPFSSYVDVSPESPYTTYWKASRPSPDFRGIGSHDYHRSPVRSLYPHKALLSANQSAKKTSPRHQAIIQELKTTLPGRNEQRLTVL